MEHPENNPEYAGLTVNSGVAPVTAVNPHLNRQRFARHRLTANDYVEGIKPSHWSRAPFLSIKPSLRKSSRSVCHIQETAFASA